MKWELDEFHEENQGLLIGEIELEREGEVEIKFVPIRPGNYEFEIEGLQSKGMVGKFIVK